METKRPERDSTRHAVEKAMEVKRVRRRFMLFRHPDALPEPELLVGRGFKGIEDLRPGEAVSLVEVGPKEIIIDEEILETVYKTAAREPLTTAESDILDTIRKILFQDRGKDE